LFEIFKLLGYEFADACHHMSYGMISLPDGKMKSREGNVVDADTLAQEMHAECLAVIQERYPDMPNTDAHERAEQIAL
jgi:arginyl-tRNA synthetase